MRREQMTPAGAVLGIDFGGTKVALRLEAIDGDGGAADTSPPSREVLGETRLPIAAGEPARQVVERALQAARSLIANSSCPISAVGVTTPGVVHEHEIRLAPNVDGWSELALRQSVHEGLGIEATVVENDVKAAALAEAASGALMGCDPGLYLNLGTGIAAAMVVGGRVIHGVNGASGEIGYGLVGAASSLDWSGSGAPLEEYSGGRGLGERGAAHFATSGSARALLELATERDDVAQFVNDSLDELSRHVLTCVLLLDPQRVVVGGGMSRATAQVIEPIAARLRSVLSYAPEIVHSRFGASASLHGAIELARQAAQAAV